jgi:hypothetical protein
MKQTTHQRGYTLLFAVLTAALVLGVAVFIVGVSQKEYQLSVSARDSLYSFYAADSGIECATLAFPTMSTSTTGSVSITCDNATLTSAFYAYFSVPAGASPIFSTAKYPLYISTTSASNNLNFAFGNSCADITVYDGYDSSNGHWTVIDSRGYNHCATSATGVPYSPDISIPTTVERALRLSKKG